MAGFWSRLLGIDSYDAAQRVLSEPFEPFVSTRGIPVMDPGTPLDYWTRADVDSFWRTQPNVRKVIGFIARQVASIPLHTFERVSDTERKRVTDHALPRLLSRPQPRSGAFRFWNGVLSDGLLYDRWAVLKERQAADGSVHLAHVPSWRVRFAKDPLNRVTAAWFWTGEATTQDQGEWVELDLDDLIFDYGYAPRTAGMSPVETLKDVLDETSEAVQFRRDVWENGGLSSQWIGRPMDAKWSPEQRNQFVTGLREFRKDGARSGGIMLLEDGMGLNASPVSLKDATDLDGRQLAAVEVASAYHISPELIGAREGNYSNIDAFRQMMYGPSLGPYIEAWEQAINVGLTEELAEGRALYVEANVEAKLRGSFVEQAQIMQSATGAPWLTRNEARALQNREPVEGGDELVVPLNVLIGGQASPRDSGSQNLRSAEDSRHKSFMDAIADTPRRIAEATEPRRVKAAAPDTHHEQAARQVAAFFNRQGRSVLSRLGAGRDDWWDTERWDGELADVIRALYSLTATTAGRAALEEVGVDPDEYDEPRTQAFLLEAARRSAESINDATRQAVEAAVADDEGDPANVFDVAESSRSLEVAATVVTFAAGFGTVEAARQQSTGATKTWRVNSGNPRPSHAALDGVTVDLDEDFPNGLPWPGAAGSDADEVAGCSCSVEINIIP